MTDPKPLCDNQTPLLAPPAADILPNWVYDMVGWLDGWATEHPKLYRRGDAALTDGPATYTLQTAYVPAEDCGCGALGLVPAPVLATARAIRAYRHALEDELEGGR